MLEPLLFRILVKPEKFREVTEEYQRAEKAGIIIPEMEEHRRAQASVDIGIVVAIGPTAYQDYKVECPVQIGDRVNYARFSGKYVKDVDNAEYVILNDEDLICVIKDNKHE